jgi:hypothetical protein
VRLFDVARDEHVVSVAHIADSSADDAEDEAVLDGEATPNSDPAPDDGATSEA